jgi:hypothetical protein
MRHGKRLKSFSFLLKAIWQLVDFIKTQNDYIFKTHLNWSAIYMTFNYLNYNQKYFHMPTMYEEVTTYNNIMTPVGKTITDSWNLNTFLFKNMYEMLPMFSFYIYKVDKKIFKNTRGKSGKFTFIWKYVTQYKRIFLVMHWLLKELRIKPGRTLSDRLDLTLKTLLTEPNKTWMWRARKFSHNYVYRNSRKTLAETYRTVTK